MMAGGDEVVSGWATGLVRNDDAMWFCSLAYSCGNELLQIWWLSAPALWWAPGKMCVYVASLSAYVDRLSFRLHMI